MCVFNLYAIDTLIQLSPNAVAVIGFEQSEYTVNEEEGHVEVCVGVIEPEEIDLFIPVQFSTATDTAGEKTCRHDNCVII